MRKVAIVLLAAGGSIRMGSPKQLMPYGTKTLLQHAVDIGLASSCRPLIVVLGAAAERIRSTLDVQRLDVVVNPRWSEGMGTSIRVGIEAAEKNGAEAAILALADQPLITPLILNRLVETHAVSGKPIVASEYANTVGVPVLFGQEYFSTLLNLKPAQGCKGVIVGHAQDAICIPCPEAEVDVDTQDDYARLCAPNAHAPILRS